MIQQIKSFIKRFIPWKDNEVKIYRLYKKSRFFYLHNLEFMAKLYSYKIYKKYNCYIYGSAVIGKNLRIPHPIGIVIGDGVVLGDNVVLYQNVTLGKKHREVYDQTYPKVGNNTIIYANSVIVGSAEIGNNCMIGCNSTVFGKVDDGKIVGGVIK